MGTAARPKNLALYSTLRPRQSRSKKGCVPCRVRRKKCDEERPICGSCDKLKSHCAWPASPAGERADEDKSSDGTTPSQSKHLQVVVSAKHHSDSQVSIWDDPSGHGSIDFLNGHAPVGRISQVELLPSPLPDIQKLRQCPQQYGIVPRLGKPTRSLSLPIVVRKGVEVGMLLDHFRNETIPWMLNNNRYDYLIRRHILPLAYADSLVLHTVLAISATHLRYSTPSIEMKALKYYTSALNRMMRSLSDWSKGQGKDYRILLTAMILLCHCEFIDGNTCGAAMQHIRACRGFVKLALKHLHDPERQELVVLLVENYGYFALIANLRGSANEDNIRLGLEFSETMMPLIKDLPSFGSMFAFEPEGLSLVPLIARFSWYRAQGLSSSADREYRALYTTLQNSIRWQTSPHSSNGDDDESPEHMVSDTAQLIVNIKTNILLMFLQASFYQGQSLAIPSALLQPLIDHTILLLARLEATDSCYGLLWCFMVLGSFLRDKYSQDSLLEKLEVMESKMPTQRRGINLLQWLWNDPGNNEFGLVGLEKVAKAHGVDVFIC